LKRKRRKRNNRIRTSEYFALFAFTGEAMCFMHVLLNGFNLQAKGGEVKIIIEGAACRLAPELGEGRL
jgi:hypothetical protein